MGMVEIFKALGDENRLRIVNVLFNKQLCVCEMEALLDMTQSNVSRHLNKLKNADIITSEKQSQWVYYRIKEQFIKDSKLLYDYICDKARDNTLLNNDMQRLEKYKCSPLTCEDIRRDKNEFSNYLKGKEI